MQLHKYMKLYLACNFWLKTVAFMFVYLENICLIDCTCDWLELATSRASLKKWHNYSFLFPPTYCMGLKYGANQI